MLLTSIILRINELFIDILLRDTSVSLQKAESYIQRTYYLFTPIIIRYAFHNSFVYRMLRDTY